MLISLPTVTVHFSTVFGYSSAIAVQSYLNRLSSTDKNHPKHLNNLFAAISVHNELLPSSNLVDVQLCFGILLPFSLSRELIFL